MGIDAQLEDEEGKQIQFCSDAAGTFGRLLTASDLSGSTCLRFIDPYGNTVFNRAQSAVLIEELQAFRASADPATAAFIDNVLRFANTASRSPHHYLRFIGD